MKSSLRFMLAGALMALAGGLPAQESPALRVDVRSITVVETPARVGGVSILNRGFGYESTPTVTLLGGGTGATAVAIVEGGSISRIEITNPGNIDYIFPPLVLIEGGAPSGDRPFTPATAAAFLTGDVFNPPNEASGPVQTPINIEARALGTNVVESYTYRFFVNGVPIGESSVIGPPNSATYPQFTPPRPGVYYFSVTATDGMTTVSSPAVRYFATGTAITSPLDNTIVPIGSSVTIKADATPPAGFIEKIEFWVNGAKVGEDSTAPYSMNYTPVGTAGQIHTITAIATDNNGTQLPVSAPVNLQLVNPVGVPPTVSFAAPLDGAILPVPNGTPIPISIVANDPDGRIERVEVYVDGVLFTQDFSFPYTASWTPTAVGQYQLSALAYDDKNNVVTSPVVTVSISAPPTVAISSPAAGTTVTVGSPTVLVANAADSDGSIVSVDFFAGEVYIGSDNTAPYSVAWMPAESGAVSLTARANDNVGLSTVSAPVSVNVTGGGTGGNPGGPGGPPGNPGQPIGAAPTTSLIAPTAGTEIPVNTPVTLVASAADTDGNIVNVQFFAGTVQIGADAAYPYSATWTPTSLGTYTLTSRVTDDAGNVVASSPVIVTVVDPSPGLPQVAITFPTPSTGIGVGTPVVVSASAIDPDGSVAGVQFYVNGQPLGSLDTAAPFNATWTPNSAGSYTLTARATDNTGNQATSEPVVIVIGGNSGPTVTITSPANNGFVFTGTPITVSANATDVDGSVVSVSFLANGALVGTANSAPFSVQWTPGSATSYSLVAYATDNTGNVSASAPVTVSTTQNQAPTVRITSPAAGAPIQLGTTVTVRATATDMLGTIGSVQFFANGVAIGNGTTGTGGYIVNWSPTSAGIYRLTAIATDNGGVSAQSGEVLVAVIDPYEGEIDTVYGGKDFGLYLAGTEVGRFTLVKQGNTSATLIGYSTSGTPKVYFYRGMEVDAGGTLVLRDGANSIVTGMVSPAGASGTFDNGRASFSGPVAFGNSGYRGPTGLFLGSLTGKPASVVTGIVGGDGTLTLHIKDGTTDDAGAGSLGANGNFAFNLTKGSSVTGRLDPVSGFLSATVTGPISGAALATSSTSTPASDGFLRNLSTRGFVGTGDRVMIVGFYIDGHTPKQLLIRGIGPGLTPHGVTGVLGDPMLRLFNGDRALVAANDDWAGNPVLRAAATSVGAFPLADDSLDSVILVTLAPGAYSAQMSGVGNVTGVGLIELYDVDALAPFSSQRLINVSTRGEVGTGNRVLIAGFNVNGSSPKRLLVRGVGPTLANHGVTSAVADPRLQIFQGQTVIRENDDWANGNDPVAIRTAAASVGAFELVNGSKDAALLITLPPGTYTAQVSTAGATGVGLVEVYEVD